MNPIEPQRSSYPDRCGVLPPVVRRHLADLNRQYVALGLEPRLREDPRFAWAASVRDCLQGLASGERDRLAATPFTLFRLLPAGGSADCTQQGVQDGPATEPGDELALRLASFSHQAVFLAGSLAASLPLACSLLLGLTNASHALLRDALPSQLARIASHPGLIRPRWPGHEAFWTLLAGAARCGSVERLRWAHCVGLCLFGAADSGAADPDGRPLRLRPA